MKKDKKRRKKTYRPREVQRPSIIYDVIASPALPDSALDDLEMRALIALKQIEDGKGTVEDVATVATVIDHAFVAAAAFEQKHEIRMLCLLATAATMASKGEMTKGIKPAECLIRIMREAIRLNRTLAGSCKRSELVEIARTAYRHYEDIRVNPKAAFIIEPDPEKDNEGDTDLKALEDCIGVTFINGKCRSGYLSFDRERKAWLWKMPKEGMQAVIREPIFVLFVEDDRTLKNSKKAEES